MRRITNSLLIGILIIGIGTTLVSCGSSSNKIKSCIKEAYDGYSYETIYDEKGNILSETTYDNYGNIEAKKDYFLEDNGNKIKIIETNEIWDNVSLIGTINSKHTKISIVNQESGATYNAEYDKNGNIISYDYYEDDGEYILGYKFAYDKYGSIITQITYYEEDKKDFNEENFTYKYSFDNNKRISNKEQYLDGEFWCGYDYTYDENGNILTEMCYDEDGSIYDSESYTYSYEYFE